MLHTSPRRLILPLAAAILLWTATPAASSAQSSDEALTALTKAVSGGDARSLARMGTSTIEVALFGAARQYSRRQATLLLEAFFRDYPPVSFAIRDFTKTERGWFIEGQYGVKDSVVPLRMYLRLRYTESGWLIREILIEESRGQ